MELSMPGRRRRCAQWRELEPEVVTSTAQRQTFASVGDDHGPGATLGGFRGMVDLRDLPDHTEDAGAAASARADHPQMIDGGNAPLTHDSRIGKCCGPRIWPAEKRSLPSGSG